VSRYIPFHSVQRTGKVADLVPALADVPRLGDELHLGEHGILVDDVEERGETVDVVELAGERRGEVEPEPVDVTVEDEVPQRVHDQPQHGRVDGVERVPGPGEVLVVRGVRRASSGSRRSCRRP
jgi:hypothetical protein